MAPLYTVLLCLPAVLALMLAVGGLAVLCPRQRGARRPTHASGKRDGRAEVRPPLRQP
jgi:hypothetical protein